MISRMLRGILTPAIRATAALPLPLLVSRVLADHEHPTVAADDLALLTHRLHRRSYLHDPFRLIIQTGWLWLPGRLPLPCPRTRSCTPKPCGPRARPCRIPNPFGPPSRWDCCSRWSAPAPLSAPRSSFTI